MQQFWSGGTYENSGMQGCIFLETNNLKMDGRNGRFFA
jgi:hypothetical protein